ncbi:serine/threonine protein kinase [Coniella lustricola]|uniref:Serine/threonine protein kinase n=1 Tax=Coniella lustricola TaxID=2025994 RepID=A0A2T3AAX9_9PEZI|nr:serine/threonine protein kinase [Coniella lustricola]
MHDLETLQNGGYKGEEVTSLKLTCPLDTFPLDIFDLGATVVRLDLSGTGLSSLPSAFGTKLPSLKIAFFSQCRFTTFPAELAHCPRLEMVAFRGNCMAHVPENALPPRLRWLILTDNKLQTLPRSIGACARLQKCMLAGNQLETLPQEMQACKKLGLLRLSSNKFNSIPEWLFEMPELAFLSLAGNPCSSRPLASPDSALSSKHGGTRIGSLARVAWSDLEVQETLGQGASGVILKGLWRTDSTTTLEVAIKLFKGALTSDGTPLDEMAACIAAGQHENIIDVLGQIQGHPDEANGSFQGGLVMQLIPPHYSTLGLPPSMDTCTRDTYPLDAVLSFEKALRILADVAAAAAHLHSKGLAHGDLYAHNVLASGEGHALLGDFGAATVHNRVTSSRFEQLEVLAFAHLIEDMLALVPRDGRSEQIVRLYDMHQRASAADVSSRPCFKEIASELGSLRGKPSLRAN